MSKVNKIVATINSHQTRANKLSVRQKTEIIHKIQLFLTTLRLYQNYVDDDGIFQNQYGLNKKFYASLSLKGRMDKDVVPLLGGYTYAKNLIRNCDMLTYLMWWMKETAHADRSFLWDSLQTSFWEVAECCPMVRHYYEQAKHGVAFHTYFRTPK